MDLRSKMAAMALFTPLLAMVGVGADEHVAAMVVEDDLVEIDIFGRAQCAGLVEGRHLERMVLESRLTTSVKGGTA